MNVHCPQCGKPIDADDMNLSTMAAKCGACNALFSLDGFIHDGGERSRIERSVDKNVAQPKAIQVEDRGHELRMTRRWFSPLFVFLVFFCIAWDGFLIFWYSIAFGESSVPWIMIVFPIGHLAVGVGLTYFTIAGFVNRTIVCVDQRKFSVRHVPLPWPGAQTISVDAIDQLYCKEKISRGKHGSTRVSYELMASLKGGGSRPVLKGLSDIEQALFIERRVEGFLGIRDRQVAGELRR